MSYSKIRHIQESNSRLEKRYLKEDEEIDAKELGKKLAQEMPEEELILLGKAIEEMGVENFKDYVEDVAKEKLMNESFLDTKAKTYDEAKKISNQKLNYSIKSLIAKAMTFVGGIWAASYYGATPDASVIPTIASAAVFAGLLGLDYYVKRPIEVEDTGYNLKDSKQEKIMFDILKKHYKFSNHINSVLDDLRRRYTIPEKIARKFVIEYERRMGKKFQRSSHDFIY